MNDQKLLGLQYPIGKFTRPEGIDQELLNENIAVIASFPERLRIEVAHLSDLQLDTPYRPGGWTIRQVVHHCADSHMNCLTRLKLALTEEKPVIKPYHEDLWASLPDSKVMNITPSLWLLKALHERWVFLLHSLTPEDLQKGFIHPEHQEEYRLDTVICLYAWHCNHHLAHITSLKHRECWK